MELLVIGAGPYGLAVAAEARRQGLSVTVVGEPMRFWRRNMPDGMLLRSGREWHLDAAGVHTFDAFTGGWDDEPIPVETFIAYADWFCAQEGIEPLRRRVTNISIEEEGSFAAHLDNGSTSPEDRPLPSPPSSAPTGSSPRPASPPSPSSLRSSPSASRRSSGPTPSGPSTSRASPAAAC